MKPYRHRTWAPIGQTPLQLVSTKHTRRVSAIGALALSPSQKHASFYFQLTTDSFVAEKVIDFLKQLHRHLHHPSPHKIIVLWDRLNAHRTTAASYAETHADWFQFEWFPGYAPELNPVESCWGYAKCHELSNLCAATADELVLAVLHCLAANCNREDLLFSFIKHAGLKI